MSNVVQTAICFRNILPPTMAIIWIGEEQEGQRTMESKKISMFRRRLSSEHDKLVQLIIRARRAEEEVGMEKTEDEGDLATISQERDLLSVLHESVFTRLRFIQEALTAVDHGDYGECRACGEEINEK